MKNLESNADAVNVSLNQEDLQELSTLLTSTKVTGERYTVEGMKGVNV